MIKNFEGLVFCAAVFCAASPLSAAVLSIGSITGTPGETVIVPVDLSAVIADFTSVDVAIQIDGGSGDSPLVIGYTAEADTPYVWEPFSDIGFFSSPNDPLAIPSTTQVLGISGSDLGVVTNLNARVMDLKLEIPASATVGDTFVIRVLDEFSGISNAGANVPLSSVQNGAIEIVAVPEPASMTLMIACLLACVRLIRSNRS